jgi:uncharacterized membrane protein YgcG
MAPTLRDHADEAKPVRYPVRVTHRPENPVVRRAARVLALLPAVLVTFAASAAFAEPPETWEDPPSTSALHVLLVLFLIPLGLFLLICLLVYLPSMRRGSQHSDDPHRGEAEWFGGPGGGLETVDKAEQPSVVGSGDRDSGRGGASGRW